jgi:hypothetical protein
MQIQDLANKIIQLITIHETNSLIYKLYLNRSYFCETLNWYSNFASLQLQLFPGMGHWQDWMGQNPFCNTTEAILSTTPSRSLTLRQVLHCCACVNKVETLGSLRELAFKLIATKHQRDWHPLLLGLVSFDQLVSKKYILQEIIHSKKIE